MAIDSVYVGEKIRFIRHEQGMTQKEFAKKINSTQQMLSRYENGTVLIPYTDLVNISIIFHIPIEYFLGIETQTVSEEEYVLLSYYRKMDKRLKPRAIELIRTLSEDFSDIDKKE